MKFYTRKAATAYIQGQGVPLGRDRLAQLASDGRGPPFRYRGKYALYQEPDLDIPRFRR